MAGRPRASPPTTPCRSWSDPPGSGSPNRRARARGGTGRARWYRAPWCAGSRARVEPGAGRGPRGLPQPRGVRHASAADRRWLAPGMGSGRPRPPAGRRWDRAGRRGRVVGWMNGGSWAERVAPRTDHLAELPDDLGFDAAATLPVAGLTAFGTLARRGPLLGTRVAITGAAGGVGRFAVQLAHRGGAHVTGIVGRPQRAEGLAELGADDVVMGLEAQGEPFDLIL